MERLGRSRFTREQKAELSGAEFGQAPLAAMLSRVLGPGIQAGESDEGTPTIQAVIHWSSEFLTKPHDESMGQHAEDKRAVPVVRVVSRERAQRKSRKHIRLPVRLRLETRHCVVGRQCVERVHHRAIAAVLEHKRRDCCGDCRHFAAREAVMPLSLPDFVRVVALGWA